MGTIVVFENVSLDGAIQDPTGEEGLSQVDWRAMLSPADREEWAKLILGDVSSTEALLLGRRSYEFFAERYPNRTGESADRMNALPKYVVSSTLADPGWSNSTVLKGDVLDEVPKLKQTVDGEIHVYASSGLVYLLFQHDLVDELRLVIYPILMGAGNRLFDQSGSPRPLSPKHLRLVGARTAGDNLTLATYRRA